MLICFCCYRAPGKVHASETKLHAYQIEEPCVQLWRVMQSCCCSMASCATRASLPCPCGERRNSESLKAECKAAPGESTYECLLTSSREADSLPFRWDGRDPCRSCWALGCSRARGDGPGSRCLCCEQGPRGPGVQGPGRDCPAGKQRQRSPSGPSACGCSGMRRSDGNSCDCRV